MKYLILIFPLLFACASIPVNTKNLDDMAGVVNTLPDSIQKKEIKKMIEIEKKEKTAIIKENAALNDEVKTWRKVKFICAGILILLLGGFVIIKILRF